MDDTPPVDAGRFTLHLTPDHDDPVVASPRSGTLMGPWEQAFWVDIGFQVRSKSNFRRHARGEPNRWAAHATFAERLAAETAAAVPPGWELGNAEEPLAARPVVVAHLAAVTLLDTGNVDKSPLDAVEGIVYVNDASVRAASAATVRRREDQCGWVGFARLRPGASPIEVLDAHVALLEAWRALGTPPLPPEDGGDPQHCV